jgi:AcrR family transcriptional regulator
MSTHSARLRPAETDRYQQMRERIVDAASALINQNGVKGMTLADVGQMVDLNTTSVTYYFKRKELLAAAAIEQSLGRIEDMVAEAGAARDPRARISAFVTLQFDLRTRIRRKQDRAITVLSDMRALEEPLRSELGERYRAIFRGIRDFFGPSVTGAEKALCTARAHVLIENMFWLPVWLGRYSTHDFDRVRARLLELFDNGLAPANASWTPRLLAIEQGEIGGDAGHEAFLHAATRLINERGYRGASVERIASELNVTKGSFYHHLNAKDHLVLDCFERSNSRVAIAQRAADAAGGSHWQRLSSTIATLLDVQFRGDFPLLRTAALQAVPGELRGGVIEGSNRMARRFAGTIIDGITEGSIRAVDPLVASQLLVATLNAAFELRKWAGMLEPAEAVRLYASTLTNGLYRDPPG